MKNLLHGLYSRVELIESINLKTDLQKLPKQKNREEKDWENKTHTQKNLEPQGPEGQYQWFDIRLIKSPGGEEKDDVN